MKKYADLINQTFDFPTKEFTVKNNNLYFHNVNILDIIERYGTPLKLSFLPKIKENIQYAKKIFHDAIQENNYEGSYTYAYCTKSSHFKFVLEEVLGSGSHLETSSAYDIPIIKNLFKEGNLSKNNFILCNGIKQRQYLEGIESLINAGFNNCIPILDNLNEIDFFLDKEFKRF